MDANELKYDVSEAIEQLLRRSLEAIEAHTEFQKMKRYEAVGVEISETDPIWERLGKAHRTRLDLHELIRALGE